MVSMVFKLSKLFSSASDTVTVGKSGVVGVDIGSSSVKVVELEQREDVIALKTYGELQLGPYGGLELGQVTSLDKKRKTEALVDVFRESGIKATKGVIALPLSSSFVTIININADIKKEPDIGPRVRVEARKYIPVPISDVSLDWFELPPLGDLPENTREVLVAAIQNDVFSETMDIISAVNNQQQPSEIELFSSMRSTIKSTDTSLAILDLGADTSKLYIVQDGMPRKIYRNPVGGSQVTQNIADALNVKYEEAENLKRNYYEQMPEAQAVKKAFVETYERPLQEFRKVLLEYEARQNKPVGRVVVTGGGAAFLDTAPYVAYMFDVEVERAKPFSKIAYPAFMEDVLFDIGPTFSVAVGSALRHFE